MNTKNFTILHSNDMHGDFLAECQGKSGRLIGGLAHLSGYINKVRQEEENVLYVISGDMLQGSVIDTEYKGISTMEIMNYLAAFSAFLREHLRLLLTDIKAFLEEYQVELLRQFYEKLAARAHAFV